MYLCDLLRVFEGGLLIKGCVWDKWVEGHVWRNFVWIVKQLGGCEQRLRGVERAGACCIIKTSPAPGQLFRTQDCRNERPMNGFLCVTMTAALSEEGMVRGPCYGWAALSVWVCMYVRESERESTLRNYSGMWGYMPETKNLSHIQWNLTLLASSEEISQSHQKAWPVSHSGWN